MHNGPSIDENKQALTSIRSLRTESAHGPILMLLTGSQRRMEAWPTRKTPPVKVLREGARLPVRP